MNPSIIFRLFHGSIISALLAFPLLRAADGTWNGSADTLWSTPGNWNADIADGAGLTAMFNNLDLIADLTVNLDSERSIGNLIFDDTDTVTAFGWTLANNATPANILTLAGTTPTITVNALGTANLVLTLSPKSVIMSGVIAGTSGLTKDGSGRLKITGTANTYTGSTVINGGKLSILGENSLGATPVSFEAANIAINNGGVLELTALVDLDNNGSSVSLNVNRGITLGAGVQFLQRNHRGQNFVINGTIAGAGGLVLSTAAGGDQGGGTGFSINAANTHTGDTYLGWPSGQIKGYACVMNHALALQNSTLNYVNYFGFAETLYRENVTTLATNSILGGLAGGVNAGQVKTLAVPSGLKIGNNNQSTTFSGKLVSSGSLEKIGNGTLTLTRSDHTYSGATTVSAGKLALGAFASINNSSGVTIKPGAVFDTSAIATYTLPSLPKTYTFQIDGTGSGSSGKIKAASLNIDRATVVFTEVTAPDDPVYVIAEHIGIVGPANFFSATPPAGYAIDYAYAGGTQIALVSITRSPYGDWAAIKGLTGVPSSGTDPAKDADPDKDGRTNSQEFALDGDPLSGINDGKVVGKVALLPSDNSRVLTLSLPVRAGAAFNGPGDLVSNQLDDLKYFIQGSDDLSDFTLMTITEITGSDVASVQTGLPPLSSAAWTYRTFRSPGTVDDGDPEDFLRVKIEHQ